jgi:tartrate dehydratase beta subunit/fumarate hydratase class I family protein
MKDAAEIAEKMLQVSLVNLWEDLAIEEIRFVCEITEFKEFVSEVEAKGKELQENSEESS